MKMHPGVHFTPKDEELVNFLMKRLNREPPLPYPHPVMVEIDVYSEHPSVIFSRLGKIESDEEDMERYLFTRLTKSGSSNKELKNRSRRVKNQGYWKNQRSYNVISRENNDAVVGLKKLLSYEPAETEKKDGVQWIMHEYSSATSSSSSNLVLCRLKRKLPPPPKEEKEKEKEKKEKTAKQSSKKRTPGDHARLPPSADNNKRPCFNQQPQLLRLPPSPAGFCC